MPQHKKKRERPKKGRLPPPEGDQRQTRLLDAATAVFLDAGFSRATMTAIARKAGCSLETLYVLYPNKDSMFSALIARRSASLFQAVGELSLERDFAKVLLSFSVELLATIMRPENRELQRLVIAEIHAFPELGRIFWREAPGRAINNLTDYLTKKRKSGVITLDHPEHAAEVFISLLVGGLSLRATLGLETRADGRKQQLAWAQKATSLFHSLLQSGAL